VIADPPSLTGAPHATDACASPAVAVTFAGAPGTVADADGVTAFDATDDGPVPTAFAADTVNVYDVPFVSPGTTTLSAPLVDADAPPGDAVTV